MNKRITVKFFGCLNVLKFRRHEACRPTQCLAENDIKPQNFTSSVTSRQLLLEEKPIVAFAPDEDESYRFHT